MKVEFEKSDPFTPVAYLHVATPDKENSAREYDTAPLILNNRGQFVIPLKAKETTITLRQLKK